MKINCFQMLFSCVWIFAAGVGFCEGEMEINMDNVSISKLRFEVEPTVVRNIKDIRVKFMASVKNASGADVFLTDRDDSMIKFYGAEIKIGESIPIPLFSGIKSRASLDGGVYRHFRGAQKKGEILSFGGLGEIGCVVPLVDVSSVDVNPDVQNADLKEGEFSIDGILNISIISFEDKKIRSGYMKFNLKFKLSGDGQVMKRGVSLGGFELR